MKKTIYILLILSSFPLCGLEKFIEGKEFDISGALGYCFLKKGLGFSATSKMLNNILKKRGKSIDSIKLRFPIKTFAVIKKKLFRYFRACAKLEVRIKKLAKSLDLELYLYKWIAYDPRGGVLANPQIVFCIEWITTVLNKNVVTEDENELKRLCVKYKKCKNKCLKYGYSTRPRLCQLINFKLLHNIKHLNVVGWEQFDQLLVGVEKTILYKILVNCGKIKTVSVGVNDKWNQDSIKSLARLFGANGTKLFLYTSSGLWGTYEYDNFKLIV